jgi:hypothetical protein
LDSRTDGEGRAESDKGDDSSGCEVSSALSIQYPGFDLLNYLNGNPGADQAWYDVDSDAFEHSAYSGEWITCELETETAAASQNEQETHDCTESKGHRRYQSAECIPSQLGNDEGAGECNQGQQNEGDSQKISRV